MTNKSVEVSDSLRIVRNKGRIGKPWLLVKGSVKKGPLATACGKAGRWVTDLQLAEFANREDAERALADYARGNGP